MKRVGTYATRGCALTLTAPGECATAEYSVHVFCVSVNLQKRNEKENLHELNKSQQSLYLRQMFTISSISERRPTTKRNNVDIKICQLLLNEMAKLMESCIRQNG